MNRIVKSVFTGVLSTLLFACSHQSLLQASTNAAWYIDDHESILKAIFDYLPTVNFSPYVSKGNAEFKLEGFESSSGQNGLAFPIGKISQNEKQFYVMFIVKQDPTLVPPYAVRLFLLSNDLPPSVILVRDIINQISIIHQIRGPKIDNPKLMIERLPNSNDSKTIYAKWILFDDQVSATYYVTTTPDAKGETDFSVSETPFPFLETKPQK